MPRYIDADALKDRMLNYYECVNADTSKSNYKGETLMNYEVADMIEDCIDNAATADVVPNAEVERLEKEIKALAAFKEYFIDLYGKGLEVANWHENGALEPFDNFFESAEDEYEKYTGASDES